MSSFTRVERWSRRSWRVAQPSHFYNIPLGVLQSNTIIAIIITHPITHPFTLYVHKNEIHQNFWLDNINVVLSVVIKNHLKICFITATVRSLAMRIVSCHRVLCASHQTTIHHTYMFSACYSIRFRRRVVVASLSVCVWFFFSCFGF